MNGTDRLTSIKTDHIFHLTDDTGMLQHSIYGVPNLTEGYTTDDNARALIMAVDLYRQYHGKKFEKLIYRYTAFLCNAQNIDGTFRNFMGYNREFQEKEGSEDCFGRCLWALCFAVNNSATPLNVKQVIRKVIELALPNCFKLVFPRAKAYAVIGLGYLDGEKSSAYISNLADSLVKQYDLHNDSDWHWFEDSMTYCNATLPWAMLVASKITKEERYLKIGFQSLNFLKKITFAEGYFKPIGCNGWFQRGKNSAQFDEQPVEACEMILMFLEAYAVSKDMEFLEKAKMCLSWYRGNNSKELCLIDQETGGCYDGIGQDGLNLNQGAESVVSFWIAYLTMQNQAN